MNLSYTNEKDFIRRLTEIVEAHLDNEQFGVEELTKISGLSHSTLHRRLKKSGKQSVSQFIRSVRMQKAMLLLQQDEFSVSEVAWKTGFGSPAYFSSSFHEYFGFSPSEVKKMNIPERGSNGNAEVKENEGIQALTPKTAPETGSFHKYRRFIRILTVILPILVLGLIVYMAFFRIAPAKSIIVMPFMDYSGEVQNPYFSDGIREDILNDLNNVSNLRVISRTTSDHFRGKNMTSGEIAREVRARYVLEGSVRQEGMKVRISIQLIDARSDRHLWSEKYDRELAGFIGMQGEIARKVAEKLETVLTDQDIKRINKLPTQNPEAYDHYLRGRFLMNQASGDRRADLNKEGLVSSIKYFELAVRADSSFALAYAGLADAWLTLAAWGWYKPYSEGLRKAMEYAGKALEIDPDCAEAHQLKACWLIWPERKFEEGRREFETTLRLSPNFPGAHQNFAQALMITGPIEEARRHIDRSIELDPYFWVAWNLNTWIYYFEEKYEKAIEACQMARDLKGNYHETDWLFFLNYAQLGESDKAAEELQRLLSRYPGTEPYIAEIKDAAQKSGVPGIFRWLIDLNLHHPINKEGLNGHPFFLSWWYARLGEKEKSIYWLEKNMTASWNWQIYFDLIATNPDFDLLRNDPRFLSIIGQWGLTAYNRRKVR